MIERYNIWLFLSLIAGMVSQGINQPTQQEPIRCMNFYGLETDHRGLVCDWVHQYSWYLDHLVGSMRINTIRLPFSYEYITYHDTSLMASFIEACNQRNLRVILDWHRTWMSHQGPTPEEGLTLQQFIDAWIHILQMFPNVYGVGIFNEIQPPDFEYTNSLHRQVISAIEKVYPGKYYYFAGCPRWGGDCESMELSDMPTWNRTFIEVHKYIFSGNSTPADWDVSIPSRIPSSRWFVGETGWKNEFEDERLWAEEFLSYLSFRKISNLCAWTIAHSGDTEGWWNDDCETFNWDKAAMLNSFWTNSLKQNRKYMIDNDGITSDNHPLLRRAYLSRAPDSVVKIHINKKDRP